MIRANRLLATVFVVLGAAILVRTAAGGGGQVGVLAGAVFIVLGVLRWRVAGGGPRRR